MNLDPYLSFALLLIVLAFWTFAYFLPTIVAARRRAPNVEMIVVVNVFLGWTLIGWVVALALAMRAAGSRVSSDACSPSP